MSGRPDVEFDVVHGRLREGFHVSEHAEGGPVDPSVVPWPQYAAAVVELVVDGMHLVLMPDDMTDDTPDGGTDPADVVMLADHGVPVWVLTAGDPYPVVLDSEENARRNALLDAELTALGIRCDPALGRAPDGSVSELSIAARGTDRGTVLAAAARHGQLAVYEITDWIRCVDVATATVVTERSFRLERAPAGSGLLVGPTGWDGTRGR